MAARLKVGASLKKSYDGQYSDSMRELRMLSASFKAENVIDVCAGQKYGKVLEVGCGDGIEGLACHERTLSLHGESVDPRIKDRIEIGHSISSLDYARALTEQRRLQRSAVARMQSIDAILAPTTLYPAPKIADVSKAPARLTTRLVNYLGLCAVSVPCGFTSEGLPVGLQLIGKPFDEVSILRLALAYERATTWHERKP